MKKSNKVIATLTITTVFIVGVLTYFSYLYSKRTAIELVERSRYAAEKSKMVYTPRICPISGIYKKGVYIMIPTEVNRF
ncbi:MAG: hypothetical protein WAZ60_20005, partial [Desulfosalsimonadaceae bacterium]